MYHLYKRKNLYLGLKSTSLCLYFILMRARTKTGTSHEQFDIKVNILIQRPFFPCDTVKMSLYFSYLLFACTAHVVFYG